VLLRKANKCIADLASTVERGTTTPNIVDHMTSTLQAEAEDRSLIGRAKSFGSTALRYAKLTVKAFGNDNTFELGAALAYYTIFSIVPLLVVVIAISGLIAGPDAAEGRLFGQISGLVGADTALALQSMLGDAYLSGRSLKATIIGIVTLFIGATTVFNSLKNSMNKIWSIQPRPKSSILAMLRTRVLAFSLVLGMGFLLVVSFGVNALVVGFATRITEALPGASGYILTVVTLILELVFTTGIFATLFKYLPDAEVEWKDVVPGAIFTTVLFDIGKWLIAFYFDQADPASTFGAAAGLISLLLWTAYSSQIFFLGAEFTYVWAQEHGRPIKPNKSAVRVIQQDVMIDRGKVVSKTTKDDVLDQVREDCTPDDPDCEDSPAAKEGA
jgi:membrane protein